MIDKLVITKKNNVLDIKDVSKRTNMLRKRIKRKYIPHRKREENKTNKEPIKQSPSKRWRLTFK